VRQRGGKRLTSSISFQQHKHVRIADGQVGRKAKCVKQIEWNALHENANSDQIRPGHVRSGQVRQIDPHLVGLSLEVHLCGVFGRVLVHKDRHGVAGAVLKRVP
jgi:hypothetical protein